MTLRLSSLLSPLHCGTWLHQHSTHIISTSQRCFVTTVPLPSPQPARSSLDR